MSGSAADFLTFSRRLLLVKAKPSIRLSTAYPSSGGSSPFLAARQRACLSTSARLAKRDEGTPHTTDKDSDGALDVQAESSRSAKEDKAQGGTSPATSGKDPHDSQKKIKEEFPEAPPGPVIGMQDQIGRKGV